MVLDPVSHMEGTRAPHCKQHMAFFYALAFAKCTDTETDKKYQRYPQKQSLKKITDLIILLIIRTQCKCVCGGGVGGGVGWPCKATNVAVVYQYLIFVVVEVIQFQNFCVRIILL